VGWTLILMDALDTKERWGRAKRWESPSCDLTGCDNLSEEELYSETHLSISKVSKAHVSAAEAGARLVAVSCAFSGNGSRFGYSRLAASRVLQKVRHQVKGRKTGVVLFAEEVADPAEHRQVYAAHQLALAKGVGVMRQMSLEGAKSMSSSEKFCAFGLIRATDPTWQKPWSKETVARNYCAVSWNGAQEIFWPRTVSMPSAGAWSSGNKYGITFKGICGLLLKYAKRLKEHDVRDLKTKEDRLRYAALDTPIGLVLPYLQQNAAKWTCEGKMQPMKDEPHMQAALTVIMGVFMLAHHLFNETHIGDIVKRWEKEEVGHQETRFKVWQESTKRKTRKLEHEGKTQDILQQIEELESHSKREAGLVEELNFAKMLNDKFLLPCLAVFLVLNPLQTTGFARTTWIDYCILGSMFRDLSFLYDRQDPDGGETGVVAKIPSFLYYLRALTEGKKLEMYLDEPPLVAKKKSNHSGNYYGGTYFPGTELSAFRIMVQAVKGQLEESDDEARDLFALCTNPPHWLLTDQLRREHPALQAALQKDWATLELDQRAIAAHLNLELSDMGSSSSTPAPGVEGHHQAKNGNEVTNSADGQQEEDGQWDSALESGPRTNRVIDLGSDPSSKVIGGDVSSSGGGSGDECTVEDKENPGADAKAKPARERDTAGAYAKAAEEFMHLETRQDRDPALMAAEFELNHFDIPDGYKRTCRIANCRSQRLCLVWIRCIFCKGPIHPCVDEDCPSIKFDRSECCPLDDKRCVIINQMWQEERKSSELGNSWPPPHPRIASDYPAFLPDVSYLLAQHQIDSSSDSEKKKRNAEDDGNEQDAKKNKAVDAEYAEDAEDSDYINEDEDDDDEDENEEDDDDDQDDDDEDEALDPSATIALDENGEPTEEEKKNHPGYWWSPLLTKFIPNGHAVDGTPSEAVKAKYRGKYYSVKKDQWIRNPRPRRKLDPQSIYLSEEGSTLLTKLCIKLRKDNRDPGMFESLQVAFNERTPSGTIKVLQSALSSSRQNVRALAGDDSETESEKEDSDSEEQEDETARSDDNNGEDESSHSD